MVLLLKSSLDSSSHSVKKAAEIIRGGGVVAFPTETVYGLGALASNAAAVERIYRLKRRSRDKPISILIPDPAQLQHYVADIPPGARRLMARFWPGPLTLLFPAVPEVPSLLMGGSGKIGIRLSCHPVASLLVRQIGAAITATSANRSGAPSCCSCAEVIEQFGSELDAVVDGGLTPGSKGSTIADVTTRPPEILRVGVISAREVLTCWQGGEPQAEDSS
ncbi:MAG: threonylcarbamoyl-AMP synthase [Deltaproteobacteria bacterium]|nr:threonylcarbamoyl-AMP synthase [Deltaproteobacteria bacterium]MBW2071263.1 threonylcarbamoyl-AMP synthase [Deltaproteobacteria bacterium]